MKSQAEYLHSFGHCPFCDSSEIEGASIDVNADVASQEVSCTDCGASWLDHYQLSAYEVVTEPAAA